jgi:adenylate cyclase
MCAAALSLTVWGEALEERFGLWVLFNLRGARAAPQEVVIIALRSDTGDRISLPRLRSNEQPCADLRVDEIPATHRPLGDVPQRWGRCHFAELMRRLIAAKPRVVAFDVGFRPRDDLTREEDRAVASAIRNSRNVVLAQKVKMRWLPGGIAVEDGPVELSRDIAAAALGIAPTPVPKQAFDRIDMFQTFKDGPWSSPTLPALAAQVYALDAYTALRGAVDRILPGASTDLPAAPADLVEAGQLEAHMLHLRGMLLSSRVEVNARAAGGLDATSREKVRTLLDLYRGETMRYLNFYGPPGTIRTIHIADVLSIGEGVAATDPLRLHDKAVFVGYADNREWDMEEKFATVYGDGLTKMSGVELLATAFANLLDESDLAPASHWLRLSIVFVAASTAALACYAVGTLSATLLLFAASAAYAGLAVLALARLNAWLPVFLPLAAALPGGYFVALGYKLLHYKRDRATLREILGKFVPPDVRNLMEDNAKRLDRIEETMNAACVMTDIEGFTTLSARFSSESMLELLRGYFVAIFKPIADYGGFVVDLKGDSILAVWPDRESDAAVRRRVCEACLALQTAVERFNSSHADARMPTRVGVNYGVVTLAPVGSLKHHMEYSAIGDTVNAGSRIEELGKEVGAYLLVSESMVKGLDGFLVRDLGEFSLRGRATPMRVIELMGHAAEASPERIQLCRRFLDARKAFEAADLERAHFQMLAILKDFPNDGPSRHCLRTIERRMQATTIRLRAYE